MKKIILALAIIAVSVLVSGCCGNGCNNYYTNGCCGSDGYTGTWY